MISDIWNRIYNLILICNKYIISYQNNKLMILPPIHELTGEVRSRENWECTTTVRLQFIFASFLLYLVCFQFSLYTSFFIKLFFFGECKREVIEEVVVCCSTLSLFRFLWSVGERRSKYLCGIWRQSTVSYNTFY